MLNKERCCFHGSLVANLILISIKCKWIIHLEVRHQIYFNRRQQLVNNKIWEKVYILSGISIPTE